MADGTTLATPRLILRPPVPKTLRGWLDIAVVGFLIQVAYFGLCYIAFKTGVSAGGVAIIVCLQPILVALIAPRLVGETVSTKGWLGLILGLIAGYGPRWLDSILVLIFDSMSSLPMIFFALAVITVLGPGDMQITQLGTQPLTPVSSCP